MSNEIQFLSLFFIITLCIGILTALLFPYFRKAPPVTVREVARLNLALHAGLALGMAVLICLFVTATDKFLVAAFVSVFFAAAGLIETGVFVATILMMRRVRLYTTGPNV